MESIASWVLAEEILTKLDLETLCSVACVSTTLRAAVVSHVLPSLSSLDLSGLSPDVETLNHIVGGCVGLKSLTINCLRLDELSVRGLLGPHLQELHLLSCALLSSAILASLGQRCPNLRILTLELADRVSPQVFQSNLAQMLNGCLYLESLHLKVRGTQVDATAFRSVKFFLPETLKDLKLQPMLEEDAILLINRFRLSGSFLSAAHHSSPFSPLSFPFKLQSLSLCLNLLSDRLIRTICGSLPLLIKLDLEDRPEKEPLPQHDLTNSGIQSLGSCQNLTSLSLVRTSRNRKIAFKRVNDMGIFLLSEACKGLESVRLCGFPKVSDAGFASVLHSCQNLKKFEVRGALLLSDLAFHDMIGAPCSLVEVRLSSCPLITSEGVKKLASGSNLELLDLGGCKSVADSCLSSITYLHKLSSLNLSGADITDTGLSLLGKVTVPIKTLCLRGCKRVTDRGISFLLHGEGTINNTLSTLDLGHTPGISDKAIRTIAICGSGITELCIRNCFHVTDSSVEALATRNTLQDGRKQLRKLDIHNCISVSPDALRWLKRPSFCGLHWLGLGRTLLARHKDALLDGICKERPWLTLCLDGCEMGCYDGWEFHGPESH